MNGAGSRGGPGGRRREVRRPLLGAPATLAATLFILLARPHAAAAHAFGTRYDLPLPLNLFLLGAGATVGLSFVILAVFLTKRQATLDVPRLRLWRPAVGRGLPAAAAKAVVECLSVALFFLTIAAGVLGGDRPAENFAPVMVWIIWWVGMAFFSALVGNLWRLVNPWDILFRWFEAVWRRLSPGRSPLGRLAYPAWAGAWPAALLFLVFAWLELLWPDRSNPQSLAAVILAYSCITWAGMALYGRRVWLEHGEVFTLVFSIFARFAPLEAVRDGPAPGLYLRPYALGLVTREPVALSLMVLVLMLLSTVAFDGFVETPVWFKIVDRAMLNDVLRHLLTSLEWPPRKLIVAIKSVGLVIFPLLFVAIYLAFSALTRFAGRSAGGPELSLGRVAGSFVFSLVPIAIAYHMAHYLLFLLQTGQMIIPLVSDPFATGWNLFGTAAYRPSINVMNAKVAWHLALSAIVLGHVLAVYLAHVTALQLYETRRAALWSQLPMVALMIGYTMVSLWILSQPIVA